jgi:hypothetical protein
VTRTVDIVIAGNNSGAVRLAKAAMRKGLRVLVVCRESSTALERLRRAGTTGTLRVMCGARVVCVVGVGATEAVVVRARSGKLIGVNASRYFTSSNSTSNTSVALGGITPPAPRAP